MINCGQLTFELNNFDIIKALAKQIVYQSKNGEKSLIQYKKTSLIYPSQVLL